LQKRNILAKLPTKKDVNMTTKKQPASSEAAAKPIKKRLRLPLGKTN